MLARNGRIPYCRAMAVNIKMKRNLFRCAVWIAVFPVLAAAIPHASLADGRVCPPGLSKKAVPCVPPGQAKKWAVGQSLPEDILWRSLDNWQQYGLPRPDAGQAYVRVDNEVLLLGMATRMVLRSFGILN